MSGLVTEGRQENIAEKNSYIVPKIRHSLNTYGEKKSPKTMNIYKTCQRNKNILLMKFSL